MLGKKRYIVVFEKTNSGISRETFANLRSLGGGCIEIMKNQVYGVMSDLSAAGIYERLFCDGIKICVFRLYELEFFPEPYKLACWLRSGH